MKLDITLFKCSGCSVWSKYQSEIEKHCTTTKKCIGQVAIKETIEHEFTVPDDLPPRRPIERQRPGPKPLDIESVLQGRNIAFRHYFSDEGAVAEAIDRRNDYLFETEGLLEECITMGSIEERLGNLFTVLFGHRAPESLQSIIIYRGKVYVMEGTTPEGVVQYTEYHSIFRYFKESSFFEDFLERVDRILIESIPSRNRQDLNNHVEHIYKFIKNVENKLTLLDALSKNDNYEKYRKRSPDMVKKASELTKILAKELKLTTVVERMN